jgi:hypothetical protein
VPRGHGCAATFLRPAFRRGAGGIQAGTILRKLPIGVGEVSARRRAIADGRSLQAAIGLLDAASPGSGGSIKPIDVLVERRADAELDGERQRDRIEPSASAIRAAPSMTPSCDSRRAASVRWVLDEIEDERHRNVRHPGVRIVADVDR